MKLRYPLSILVVAALTVAACNAPAGVPPVASSSPAASTAPGTPGSPVASAPATGASAAPAANAPAAGTHATYKAVVDPKTATAAPVKVKEYWDFDKNSPMEIENYESKFGVDRDKDGTSETLISAQVKLPTPKTMALLQAAEDLEDESDDESDEELDEEGEEDTSTDLDDDEVASLDEDSDGDWDEDDDGFTDYYEEETEDDATEEYTEEEETALLSGPHQVTMDVEDLSYMQDEDDTIWIDDETTGDSLMITHAQEWTDFEIENEAGTLKVVFNPDGTYLIDDQPAADAPAAIALLQKSPVVTSTSKHAIAFLAARLGRLPEEATRSGCPSTAVAYHVTSSGKTPVPVLRAHTLTEGLVKQLVSFQQ